MPESRCTTHSVRKPKPSLPMVTCPENPPSKYFAVASATRALIRVRSASPTSIFLPETRNCMTDLRCYVRSSGDRAERRLLFPSPLHGGRNSHRLAVFCDGSPGDVDPRLTQLLDDGIVG